MQNFSQFISLVKRECLCTLVVEQTQNCLARVQTDIHNSTLLCALCDVISLLTPSIPMYNTWCKNPWPAFLLLLKVLGLLLFFIFLTGAHFANFTDGQAYRRTTRLAFAVIFWHRIVSSAIAEWQPEKIYELTKMNYKCDVGTMWCSIFSFRHKFFGIIFMLLGDLIMPSNTFNSKVWMKYFKKWITPFSKCLV